MHVGRNGCAALLAVLLGLAGLGVPAAHANDDGAPAPAAVVDARVLSATTSDVHVIVQKLAATDRAPEAAISNLGGTVTHDLPIVDGFAATVPAAATAHLASIPGIRAVTLDETLHPQGLLSGPTNRSPPSSAYIKEIRADSEWAAGVTGQGVTVALLDTGVANVPDLAARVLPVRNHLHLFNPTRQCDNLTDEPMCFDNYGTGTFIAGLIAGNGASSNGAWSGVAPNANLVSVKVAGADGSADVSTVLAGIQWVVSFKDRYGIKVLNLSLGTDSTQSYTVDPLNYAVEKAWDAGITVVVAASNRGPDAGTISKPGDDPLVVTVGAVDDMGTPGLGDDELPDF